MVSSIINGITDALYTKFGSTYEIYTERVEQGFLPPCFFIECNPTIERYRGRLRDVNAPCIISFYANSNASIYAIIPNLMQALETITVDSDKIHAKELQSSVNDNILTVMATYSYHSVDSYTQTDMGTLAVDIDPAGST